MTSCAQTFEMRQFQFGIYLLFLGFLAMVNGRDDKCGFYGKVREEATLELTCQCWVTSDWSISRVMIYMGRFSEIEMVSLTKSGAEKKADFTDTVDVIDTLTIDEGMRLTIRKHNETNHDNRNFGCKITTETSSDYSFDYNINSYTVLNESLDETTVQASLSTTTIENSQTVNGLVIYSSVVASAVGFLIVIVVVVAFRRGRLNIFSNSCLLTTEDGRNAANDERCSLLSQRDGQFNILPEPNNRLEEWFATVDSSRNSVNSENSGSDNDLCD